MINSCRRGPELARVVDFLIWHGRAAPFEERKPVDDPVRHLRLDQLVVVMSSITAFGDEPMCAKKRQVLGNAGCRET